MKKWQNLKNKVILRKLIKASVGNTGSLDYISVWWDGKWEVHSGSTYDPTALIRRPIAELGCESYPGEFGGINKAISRSFVEMEMFINS